MPLLLFLDADCTRGQFLPFCPTEDKTLQNGSLTICFNRKYLKARAVFDTGLKKALQRHDTAFSDVLLC